MRVLVCGSRTWTDVRAVMAELRRFDPDETIVMHGTARGADEIAGTVARSLGFTIEEYPASWTQFGRRAGIIRNLQMLDEKPDYVLAFWDGQSKGTAHCIEAARRRNIPVIFGGVWKP